MKLTLVTIVTTNLEPMCVLSAGAADRAPDLPWQLCRIYPGRAPSPCGASPSAEYGLGAVRGTTNDRVLIELEVADVELEYTRLKGLQVEWVQELTTQPWGHRAFYVRDPDGNVLNLYMTVEE